MAEEARTKLVRAQERNARLAAARVWQQEALAHGKSKGQGKRAALPVAVGVPAEKPEPGWADSRGIPGEADLRGEIVEGLRQ